MTRLYHTLAVLPCGTWCTFYSLPQALGVAECPRGAGLPVVARAVGAEVPLGAEGLGRGRVTRYSKLGYTVVTW